MKHITLVQRLGLTLGSALLATILVGTMSFVAGVGPDSNGTGTFASWLANTGLWSVPCIVLCASAALGARWVASGFQPRQGTGTQAAIDFRALLASLGVAAWVGLLLVLIWGTLGVFLLASDLSVTRASGLYGLGVFTTGLVLFGLAPAVAFKCVGWMGKAPILALAVLSALPGLIFGVLVQLGETSGVGGAFALWGVLRREELDLSFPGYACVALGLGVLAGVGSWRLPGWTATAFAAGLVGLTLTSRGTSEPTAFRIEQSGSASATLLRAYQRLADSDGDGFAATFGGGDCNDDDPAIQPEASDIAGNGVDEDCSGADAKRDVEGGVSAPPDAPGTNTVGVSSVAASSGGTTGTDGPSGPSSLPKDANIVFITIDTLRFDLGYAGNPRPLSPNLDKLAAKSLVYDNAYALASYTSKSLGPLLIGRYGSETNRGWMHFNKYPEADVMVQERLSKASISTLSVQGHWYFKADTGLGRGFDVLDMSAAPTRPQGEGDKTVNSPQLSDAAIALLKQPERANQRFFMWVHYLDPHAEYVTHADFSFGNKGREKYDAEIAFTDHHVGRVLDAIEASSFAERTIVVVTSDHGEAFGEHGLIRHGFELWEELVHVPLLVYVPGGKAKHIKVRRSAIDLVPTFLDVMGVPLPQGDDFISGQSLAGEWGGGPTVSRPIFIDMPAGPYNGDRQAYIENDLKLVVSNSRPMGLYNLATDPGEMHNLSNETEQVDAMLERLKNFRSKLRLVKVKPQ